VVIASRYNNAAAQAHVHALQHDRGIVTRLMVGQTGIQDFCFLEETHLALVGTARSTYVTWAAILGKDSSTARLYLAILDNNPNEDSGGTGPTTPHISNHQWESSGNKSDQCTPHWKSNDVVARYGFQWTNPTLQRRVKFEVYQLANSESSNTSLT
jgi:hypothetical protein